MRDFGIVVAVVELGDVLVAEQGAEGEEAAGAFGNSDGEQASTAISAVSSGKSLLNTFCKFPSLII